MSLDPARRAGLERSRALAIAREHFGVTDPEIATAPFGVVAHDDDHTVLVSSSADLAVLGGALVWLSRRPPTTASLVVEHHGAVHARRAAVIAPELAIHELHAASVRPATPSTAPAPHPTPDDIAPLVAMIERSGADAVIEDGIVRAEVAGLEVGRVVTGPDGSSFEVGVGRFDREAGALLHAERPVEPTLVDTIDRIRAHRRPGAPGDPVNRIGRERWLRTLVADTPGRYGLGEVALVEPIPPRSSLLESRAAALVGADDSGEGRVLALCTVGVDLGVIPEAADLMPVTGAERIRIIAPERDQLPYLHDLANRLPVPVDFIDIEVPWSTSV